MNKLFFLILALAAMTAAQWADAQDERYQPAPTGLPQQLYIKPMPEEIPLAHRGAEAPSAEVLAAIGRGAQLRAPMRLEVTVDGQTVVAEPVGEPKNEVVGANVIMTSQLKAGNLAVTATITYRPSATDFAFLLDGGPVDEVALVAELAGVVDMAFAGPAVGDQLQAYPADALLLPSRDGTVWSNAAPEEGAADPRRQPGLIQHFFVGNGDRGFTMTTDGKNWQLDAKAATIVLSRDQAGNVTWRTRLVNTRTTFKVTNRTRVEDQTLNLRLQIHPAGEPTERLAGWNSFAPADAPTNLQALANETAGTLAIIADANGGSGLSAEQPFSDVFPIDLFRYLAGTHTRVAMQLRPNNAELTVPGRDAGPDRLAIGRALLHDIGLDARGLAQKVEVVPVIDALQRFGFFANDANTEFLPYWRSKAIVRYGEVFAPGDAFATTDADPMARVHTSVYLRPAKDGKRQALIVVVNEGSTAVREQLYVLNPDYLFGGPNRLTAQSIVRGWDFSRIPAESDWNQQRLANTALPDRKQPPFALRDVINQGLVQMQAAEDGIEVYGPVHLPARSYRILFATGAP